MPRLFRSTPRPSRTAPLRTSMAPTRNRSATPGWSPSRRCRSPPIRGLEVAATLDRMAQRTDVFDLAALGLSPGEGRRLDLFVGVDPFDFGGQEYRVTEPLVPLRLEVSKMTGGGHALRMAFAVDLIGP